MPTIRIVFTPDDLARIKLTRTPDPLTETMRAAHAKPIIAGPLRQNWFSRTRTALGPAAAAITSVMDSALVQVGGLNNTVNIGDRVFSDVMDTVLSQPQASWRSMIDDIGERALWPVGWTSLAEGQARSLSTLSNVLGEYHRQAVAPYWDNIVSMTSARYEALTSLLVTDGVGAMLAGLHPAFSWQAPVLTFTTSKSFCPPGCVHRQWNHNRGWDHDFEFRLDGRGIVLRPSTTPEVAFRLLPPTDSPFEITFPVPEGWRAYAAPAEGSAGVSALAELLGSTRSWVLEALTGGAFTTSALARMVGISNASASEHASALRAAGLVISIRDRNAVNHHATDLGVALVRQARSNALINSA